MRERLEAIYTAALADILDAHGHHDQTLPPDIRSLERGARVAGPAYTVKGGAASNPNAEAYDQAIRKVLEMLGDVPAGAVAVYACEQEVSAHLGELSVTSLKTRGVAGCVLEQEVGADDGGAGRGRAGGGSRRGGGRSGR